MARSKTGKGSTKEKTESERAREQSDRRGDRDLEDTMMRDPDMNREDTGIAPLETGDADQLDENRPKDGGAPDDVPLDETVDRGLDDSDDLPSTPPRE